MRTVKRWRGLLRTAAIGLVTGTAGAALQAELPWQAVDAAGQGSGPAEARSTLELQWQEDDGVPWETGAGWRAAVDIETGAKALQVRFVARARAGQPDKLDHAMKVHVADAPGERPFFLCGPYLHGGWEQFEITLPLPDEVKDNRIFITMAYGWGSSTIEIRDLELLQLTEPPPRPDWRRKGSWYDGQADGAPWRAKAREMIEEHRKADVRVLVTDPTGQPVEDATVVLEQQSHAYQFGTAVATQQFRWMRDAGMDHSRESSLAAAGAPGEASDRERAASDARRYFSEIVANFNYFVVENGLKAQAWAGDWAGFRMEDTFGAIDYLTGQGLEAKGHVLVWPDWKNAPAYMKAHGNTPEKLDRLVKAHITDVGATLHGKVGSFDVMNEAFNNNAFMRIMGDGVMAEWFTLADRVLPEARLCVNEFLIIANGGRYTEKLDFYENLVQRLLDEGAPLDVIGFQNHYRHTFLTSPERIWELCDRYSRFELPLECSEFDVSMEDEGLQAAFTRDFLTAWFAHPSTRAFLFWGFWEEEHWLPDAALLTTDWRKKPVYHAYRDLVFNEWWSGWEESRTGVDGSATNRVFHGSYTVTVIRDGMTKILRNVEVRPGGLELTVRL